MKPAWTHLAILLVVLAALAGGAPSAWAGSHSATSPEFTVDTRGTNPVPPDGEFLVTVGAAAVANGGGWWNLTGTYSTTVVSTPVTLDLLHDSNGKLSGAATFTVAKDTTAVLPIRGSVKGTRGSITLKGSVRGIDPTKTVNASLLLNLTLDIANRQLVGPLTGIIEVNGTTAPLDEHLTLAIPGDMDGTWTLRLALGQAGRALTGTALLTLSNAVGHAFVVRGRTAGQTAVLSLAGDPAHPAAKAMKVTTTVTPLEGGEARLESFSGRGYGLTLGW